MHELVIVLSDLYLSQETPERELPAGVALPGLQHVARFGAHVKIAGGWRSWLGRWLTGKDTGAPAAVAAVGLHASRGSPPAASSQVLTSSPTLALPQVSQTPSVPRSLAPAIATTVAVPLAINSSQSPSGAHTKIAWMATPVHLVAGLTSVHVDRRSILRLDANDQSALAADFQRVFHDSGFELRPLDSGDFLVLGPHMPVAETLEPARSMGASIADAQRADAANPALRRLGAEIEMWLHDHAVNGARGRRGEPPVTGLWLWGGGPAGNVVAGERARSSDIAFGRDAYLQGLWAARGEKVFPLPPQLADVFGYPQPQRALLVIEIGLMLHSNPTWTFFDAVAQIDRAFIEPAIEALNRGQCERLVILANDHQVTLRARDRLKFWRRTPSGLSGLQ